MYSKKMFFKASDVAALLGRHRYKTRDAALLLCAKANRSFLTEDSQETLQDADVVCAIQSFEKSVVAQKISSFKTVIADAATEKRSVDSKDVHDLARAARVESDKVFSDAQISEQTSKLAAIAALPSSTQVKQAYVRAREDEARAIMLSNPAIESVPETEYADAVEATQRGTATKRQKTLLKNIEDTMQTALNSQQALDAARAAADEEARYQLQISTAAAALASTKRAEAATLAALSDEKAMQQSLEEEVRKRRGLEEEKAALDEAEMRLGTRINQRNTETRKLELPEYVIWGRCDGTIDDTKIIEMKTRTNWFTNPPDYDIVQLQVYLKLYNKQDGVLSETQLNGTRTRDTAVTLNDDQWNSIHVGLLAVNHEIACMTPERLKDIACTINRSQKSR